MPTEDQDIGFYNKKYKEFRKEILAKVANIKIEKKYYKQLIKIINNNNDVTLFFNSLIKVDSFFWFLKIIHHVYKELFLLYNNVDFLVFDDNLLINLKSSWQWIKKECKIINEEHKLITKLKDVVKEKFPDECISIIKFKQCQAELNFNHYFPELKLSENTIKFWKQIIQEENLDEFLSSDWKEKILDLCNNFINFEANIKEFRFKEDFQKVVISYNNSLEKAKACLEQVALIRSFTKRKQFLIDLEDYHDENYINSFQKNLEKSIHQLSKFISNIEDCKIIDYYYQLNNSNEEFAVDSLEWQIMRIGSAIENEFFILEKIKESFTNNSVTNFIIKYLEQSLALEKKHIERIEKIKLQFSNNCQWLIAEERKSIEVICKKLKVIENINADEKITYEQLSRTLEDLTLANDKKVITDYHQQIEKIKTLTKEKILKNQQEEIVALEIEEKQKEINLQKIRLETTEDINKEKENIKKYYESITEFVKFFSLSLYEFILWFKNNSWDREKYKLSNTMNNSLQPGLIIKVKYKNHSQQYKLPWSNFIYLKTENNNYLVLAVDDSEETNSQILTKESRKNLIKKLIAEQAYYYLPKKFCNLYTKFTLIDDIFLSEKEIKKSLKAVEIIKEIKIIDNETPEITNNKQKEIYQAEIMAKFQAIEKKYQLLISELNKIFPITRTEIINNNENSEINNSEKDLLQIINNNLDTYLECLVPKIKALVEAQWEETEEAEEIEKITIAFKTEFEKKDATIEQLTKIIEEQKKEIKQLKAQLPKKDITTVNANDGKEECYDSETLSSTRCYFDEYEQKKTSDYSVNGSSNSPRFSY